MLNTVTDDERELTWLLRLLDELRDIHDANHDRGGIHQLDHCLQCAHRAQTDGADRELVLVALLHDAGKPLSMTRHGEVIAEVVGHRLSPRAIALLRVHGDLQADVVHGTSSADPGEWAADARRLARWDAASFDPDYSTPSLHAFLPMLAELYGVG